MPKYVRKKLFFILYFTDDIFCLLKSILHKIAYTRLYKLLLKSALNLKQDNGNCRRLYNNSLKTAIFRFKLIKLSYSMKSSPSEANDPL